MNYRSFGKTDLKVSEIGMGCAYLGGDLYHRDDRESINTLLQAFESGINFYDTSDIYNQGLSESLMGQAFKSRRDRVIIASKGGEIFSSFSTLALQIKPLLRPLGLLLSPLKRQLVHLKDSQKRTDFSSRHLTKAIHGSLKRLQTDYLDLFQLHHPTTSILEKGDFCETLELLKAQGKIRYYGVSCDSVEDALICLKNSGISSIQVPINLLDQEAIARVLPIACEKRVAVIARVPLGQGLLTSVEGDTLAERFSKDNSRFVERKGKTAAFRFLIKEGRTMAQAALQFVMQLEGVSVVIPGMTDRRQLKENLGAFTAPLLTSGELTKIYSVGS